MIDLQNYYRKLAKSEVISPEEITDLLSELQSLRASAAFLASCQAATLESLPKSSSKSQRARHHSICLTAARALQGDSQAIRHPGSLPDAIDRCLGAASQVQPLSP